MKIEPLIKTLDEILNETRNFNGSSVQDYVLLKNKSRQIIQQSLWWAPQMETVRKAVHELDTFVVENDRVMLEKIVRNFNNKHQKFEDEYVSCDAPTINERRQELDNLSQAYCQVSFDISVQDFANQKSKTKDDRGIRKYIVDIQRRSQTTVDFEKIKEIYARIRSSGQGVEKLIDLARRRLIGGSKLNLTNVMNAYKRVEYHEGFLEAEKLQREMLNYAKRTEQEAERKRHAKITLEQRQVPHEKKQLLESQTNDKNDNLAQSKGYFCFVSNIMALGSPQDNGLYDVYEVLTGRTGAKNWHQKLTRLKQVVQRLEPTSGVENIEYMKGVENTIKECVVRGDLKGMTADSKYKIAVSESLSAIDTYIRNCQSLAKHQEEARDVFVNRRLALAV